MGTIAYTQEFQSDVFISYAFDDDEIGPSGVRWVSQLTSYLTSSLRQRLGCRDNLNVFFGNRDLSSNEDLGRLERHVQDSAVFLAVVSPSYISGEWTRRELEAFCKLAGYEDRLFVVEMIPPISEEQYPTAIANKVRDKFWHIDMMESPEALTLDPTVDQPLYTRKVVNLTGQIRNRLLALNKNRQTEPELTSDLPKIKSASRTNGATSSIGTVLLAQSTDELENERINVRNFLEQQGVEVLPKSEYSQGGADFSSEYGADLENADLYVQLLGSSAGRHPPDLPEGYSAYQFRTADESPIPILLWRHPHCDIQALPEGPYKDILVSPFVVATGLERFKTDIMSALKEATKKPIVTTPPPSMVYIGADRADLPLAQQLQMALQEKDYSVMLPTFDGSAEEVRHDLEENLKESDTLVFVHGAASTTWLRSNLRRLHKLIALRETPPSKVTVFLAPPDKNDAGVTIPYVKFIDSSDEMNPEALIAELEGQPAGV